MVAWAEVELGVNGAWNDTAEVPNTPWDAVLVPGTYAVRYSVLDDGASWPGNTRAPVGCLDL